MSQPPLASSSTADRAPSSDGPPYATMPKFKELLGADYEALRGEYEEGEMPELFDEKELARNSQPRKHLIKALREDGWFKGAPAPASAAAAAQDASIRGMFSEIRRHNKFIEKEIIISKRMRLDCWTPSKRSQVEQHEFKDALLDFYQRRDTDRPGHIFCMVLNKSYPSNHVRAAHLYKRATLGRQLPEFGLQMDDIDSPRNGILVAEGIECAFDNRQLCFLYDFLHSSLIVRVLDPTLLPQLVAPSTSSTFAEINGARLRHPPDSIPFRRILNYHARVCWQDALSHCWIVEDPSKPETRFEEYWNQSEGASDVERGLDNDSTESEP
eukprot:TRINITY_DN2856_c0_g1_i1.p1 TRINITY_DN2856_c0_g1~~TRINITY_DN2856_c0_g1_i1.p1  ORF type:complete len:339 (-),score=36.05 TRINITY_DN2856_c0_g1_i1:115-1095(-)